MRAPAMNSRRSSKFVLERKFVPFGVGMSAYGTSLQYSASPDTVAVMFELSTIFKQWFCSRLRSSVQWRVCAKTICTRGLDSLLWIGSLTE